MVLRAAGFSLRGPRHLARRHALTRPMRDDFLSLGCPVPSSAGIRFAGEALFRIRHVVILTTGHVIDARFTVAFNGMACWTIVLRDGRDSTAATRCLRIRSLP